MSTSGLRSRQFCESSSKVLSGVIWRGRVLIRRSRLGGAFMVD